MADKITLDQIESAFHRIIEHLKTNHSLKDLALDEAYYWSLDIKQMFDINDKPPVEEIGNLFDDAEFLQKALESGDDIHPILLTHLIPILNYLLEKYGREI